MDDLQVTGRIFDIQRYSIHDGPGIRTIVFFKGCPLRCRWCCNPESQKREMESMLFDGKEKMMGRDVTVSEVLDEVKKDMPYYRRSGGGMTLSGGECLFQPQFGEAVLRACKESGINTAIETTGFAKFDTIARYLPHVDTILMDIKHINEAKHKQFTTQSNKLILENARKIAESGSHLIIRVPVIPTFNNTPSEIREIAEFARSLPNVTQLHLLPYHRLGQGKYEGLNRDYTMSNIVPMKQDEIERLLEAARATGLLCQIGG